MPVLTFKYGFQQPGFRSAADRHKYKNHCAYPVIEASGFNLQVLLEIGDMVGFVMTLQGVMDGFNTDLHSGKWLQSKYPGRQSSV